MTRSSPASKTSPLDGLLTCMLRYERVGNEWRRTDERLATQPGNYIGIHPSVTLVTSSTDVIELEMRLPAYLAHALPDILPLVLDVLSEITEEVDLPKIEDAINENLDANRGLSVSFSAYGSSDGAKFEAGEVTAIYGGSYCELIVQAQNTLPAERPAVSILDFHLTICRDMHRAHLALDAMEGYGICSRTIKKKIFKAAADYLNGAGQIAEDVPLFECSFSTLHQAGSMQVIDVSARKLTDVEAPPYGYRRVCQINDVSEAYNPCDEPLSEAAYDVKFITDNNVSAASDSILVAAILGVPPKDLLPRLRAAIVLATAANDNGRTDEEEPAS